MLRHCATSLCYVVVLRLCATSLCYVVVLRRRATSSCYVVVLRRCATSSVLPQVSIKLPFADLPDVLLPFFALRVEVTFVDVLAQRLTDHRVLLEVVERFKQVPGEVVDPELTALAIGHARDVLVHRLAPVNPLLDAVQSGGELLGEREIRIRRRVGHTVFASRRVAALRRY